MKIPEHHAIEDRLEPDDACEELLDDNSGLGETELPFSHGVASGDPLTDRVVLWTRCLPEAKESPEVAWEVATDESFAVPIASGVAITDAERDYTVKVDADGLDPGTTYHYRFRAPDGSLSPVGRTRTLSEDPARVRLAVAACSSYQTGHFNSFRHLAMRDDLDAVLHLGDYIYEYGSNHYDSHIGRTADPDTDAVTLADYRARYAQTRSDPDIRAAHQAHPFIAEWDDHEVRDDIWNEGAPHFTGTLEELEAQRAAGKQAYLEWMPVRETERYGHVSLYRHVAFGSLADLILVDARLEYRDFASAGVKDDPGRSLLGAPQEDWVFDRLADSKARDVSWRLFASQVMVGPIDVPGWVVQDQTWNGFTALRTKLYDFIESEDLEDMVIVSSDLHFAAALEVPRDPFGDGYDPVSGKGSLAVEVMAGGLAAPINGRFLKADGHAVIDATHPHFKYLDETVHGYMLLDVTADRLRAEWHTSDTMLERDLHHHVDRVFEVERGEPRLHLVQGEPGPSSPCPM